MTRLKRRDFTPAWLNERALAGAAETFKTLSDPTRLRLLTALIAGPSCVNELCARLDMSQPAVSHQLRLLRVSRLVSARRDGREIFYSLADEHVMSLVAAACTHAMER
ncbi:MAG TPA: metalloregulator ArsR/SmtB family transcription factor [Polyangia bacterium]|nr:metalloregulator ArsR/SmtB family transcription factor [Polyangia bacterium]